MEEKREMNNYSLSIYIYYFIKKYIMEELYFEIFKKQLKKG